MKMVPLGETDIKVSSLCLGTMNWGSQNSAREALDQLTVALDAGVNFIDTAEFYPINPVKPETIGRAERILGLWLGGQMNRHDIVIATKHAGAGSPSCPPTTTPWPPPNRRPIASTDASVRGS